MKLLIFSDIHGDKAALEKLMAIDADYYFAAGDLANFGRGLDAMGPVLQKRAASMYVLPGNHESDTDIARFCSEFGFHDFHCKTMDIAGYRVAGLGYSNRTPFDTPGEYTEDELRTRLNKFAGLDPLILVCHTPPKNSALDRAGEGKHFGSDAVHEFIEREQPHYFFCGHIHEAAGQHAVLGRTQGWNVGKRGYLLELPALVK
ncbi:MAG TPA: metallophosphoesterase [Bryobacteraceae bacterium]|nr:metallophosphoesterase [Bryobacteraceae bacterium]